MRKFWIPCFSFLFLCMMWEIAGRLSDRLLFILPPPSRILMALWESRSRFFYHSQATLGEMGGGFLLAASVAFPLAWMMLRFRSTRSILQPLFVVIQCLPMFTLAPIMVVWFGWGYTAIVIPTALMIFFPLTLTIYQGLRATPTELLDFFRANQATEWQTLLKLRLPWALPHIFSGFRISAAIAGVGAVAGEWAGAGRGLGILMLESRRNTDLEVTFGALICLTSMSLLLYLGVIASERGLFRRRRILKTSTKPLRTKRRAVYACLLIAFLLPMIDGCQKHSEKRVRLLLDWLPNPNHVPLYAGLEKGFFAEEGIPLLIQKTHENGGGISYLTSGQADLLVNHMPGMIRAASFGAPLKIVGVLIDRPLDAFIYAHPDHIHSKSDLTNKILGYCIGGPDTSFIDYLLEKGTIQPSLKRNVSVDMISAMGTGSVDFIYGGFWNIEPFQLRSLGIETSAFKIEEFGIPLYYEMLILGKEGTPYSSPSFIAAFKRALHKSIAFCRESPEEAFALYLRHHPDKRAKTIAWERESWLATSPLLSESQDVDYKDLEDFYTWFEQEGFLPHPFDLHSLLS